HETKHEVAGRLPAAVEKNGGDEGFEDVRVHVGRNLAADALAEEEKIAEADLLAELRTGLAADDARLDLGEVPFLIPREALEKQGAGDEAEHAVAEELQPSAGG